LWYTGKERSRNGVDILIDKSLKNEVVAVRRQWDRIIMIKLIFGDLVLNVISAYAPQVGLSDDVKRWFWEDLENMVRGVPSSKKLFIGGDLNGHVGTIRGEFERVHGGFGYGEQNQEGENILNFAIAYDLIVANTFFRKKKSHLTTFSSGQHSSQIDYLLTRREERSNCMDCKVIHGECVVTQHKLLVADFYFQVCVRWDRGMKITRTRWWKLKGDVSQVFKNRVIA
jgi:exonuclease III